jgi:hypothetical protein
MTFWQFITNIWKWFEGRITRVLALALGTITTLVSTGIIPDSHLKYYAAAISLLTYWRGESTNNTYQVAKAVVATAKQPPIVVVPLSVQPETKP